MQAIEDRKLNSRANLMK